jgi:AraC-like DNA-binding protein
VTTQRDPRELGGAWTEYQRHSFRAPAPELADVIQGYWAAEWDYDTPYQQKIVPLPNVHLTVSDGGVPQVVGVASRHVIRVLEGRGRVVGAIFHPGAFRSYLGAPVASITSRIVPATEIPGLPPPPATAVESIDDLEAWLLAAHPEPNRRSTQAREIVGLIRTEPALGKVDTLAAATDMSVRQLQRLFAEYVGISPKWVLRRYRLHEVTERLAAGTPIDWAALAADLGYADQAHLSRDFADLFGESPTAYARRYPPPSGQ